MDRFWCLRCLKDQIEVCDMISSFASGATNSLVAKIGTKDLATSCWVYRISNNGRILMFKVSKRPYRSPLHDRIICKWRQCLLGGQNVIKKIIPLQFIKSSPVDRFQSLRCLNDRIDLPYMMESLASGSTNFLVAKIGTKDLATSCWFYRIWNNGRILTFK